MLEIKDLRVNIEGVPILNGFSLTVNKGEVHAIMGPNGSGKSTLTKVLGGHPDYEITSGEVMFKGKNLLELAPEVRAQMGMFISFQYPIEISGVSNFQFLFSAYQSQSKHRGMPELSEEEFKAYLCEKIKVMKMKEEFLWRNVNEGFSGGEKKRNEILQMAVLDPELAILDETDSGLDVDAMRIVAKGVNEILDENKGLILITHYQRLLDYIQPHYVHVLLEGKIVQSGGADLALHLDDKGYDWLEEKPDEVAS